MTWDPTKHKRTPKGQAGGGEFAAGSTSAAPTNQRPVGRGQGMSGAPSSEVSQLQARLNAMGIKPKLVVDGKFGPKTQAAVEQFQRTHKDSSGKPLKVDGLVGPKTTSALRMKAANVAKIAKAKKQTTTKTTQPAARSIRPTAANNPYAGGISGRK